MVAKGQVEWQSCGLDVPSCLAAASAQYFDDEDVVGQFLLDETVEDPAGFETSTALHQRFERWRIEQGQSPRTLRALQKDLTERGWKAMRKTHGRGFTGLRLMQTGDAE